MDDKERLKKWRKDNPKKVTAYNRTRRVAGFKKLEQERYRYGVERNVILERDNWMCQDCGMNQEQHVVLFGRGLTIHHIDGTGINSNNKNNNIDNLITLCLRCHARTENKIRAEEKRRNIDTSSKKEVKNK